MERYTIVTKIDSGGFGTVYKAVDVFNNNVALKRLTELHVSEQDRQRFKREVKIQKSLNHPNVMKVLDFDLETSQMWFVMPLAEYSLRKALPSLDKRKDLAILIYLQILDGVGYSHSKNVVHRDLKPENVLFMSNIVNEGTIKITDFGLGKRLDIESVTVTGSDMGLGTMAYAPPEQFTGLKNVDYRGDIFSLGKILYEILTGILPVHVDVKHPLVSGGYDYIINKCLSPNPNDRYQKVEELKNDILQIVNPQKFAKPMDEMGRLMTKIVIQSPKKEDVEAINKLFSRP